MPSIRAVLLDVDGTLYHHRLLRGLMAAELSCVPFAMRSFRGALEIVRILRCFREKREWLRTFNDRHGSLASLQYSIVAEETRVDHEMVKRVVEEWMYRRPLKYLRFCRRRDMVEFFRFAGEQGLQTGVFSDYPVREKLQALGMWMPLTVELCATDPDVNAFKPNPQGFLRACALWNLSPREVLYVGDRAEVDACGARAAGMPCAIFFPRSLSQPSRKTPSGYFPITQFRDLYDVVA